MSKTVSEPHLAFQTKLSRDGQVNMLNRKPYRNEAQKKQARADAVKCDDGAYRSTAPVTYHRSVSTNNG